MENQSSQSAEPSEVSALVRLDDEGPTSSEDDKEVIRDPTTGRWPKGVSGNPKGRPKGTKNHIKQLQMQLETAVRENLDAKVVAAIINRMAEEALAGNVAAGKLILDKVLSNAKLEEESGEEKPQLTITIENLTIKDLEKEEEGQTFDHEDY